MRKKNPCYLCKQEVNPNEPKYCKNCKTGFLLSNNRCGKCKDPVNSEFICYNCMNELVRKKK